MLVSSGASQPLFSGMRAHSTFPKFIITPGWGSRCLCPAHIHASCLLDTAPPSPFGELPTLKDCGSRAEM